MVQHPVKRIVKESLRKAGLLEFALEGISELKALKYMRGNVTYYLGREGRKQELPIPPLRMIYLVAGDFNIRWFLSSGKVCCQNIQAVLKKQRLAIVQFENILEFGCGCGRVIRHWNFLNKSKIYGTDYNEKLIEWCKTNLNFADFQANALDPPLTYKDEQFDFIYAISVFTHMPESLQFSWIRELSRVLRPKGYLLITTHGEFYLKDLTEEEKQRFEEGELVVKNQESRGRNLCSAFQSEKHVRNKLAVGFEVLEFIPNGENTQDIVLMRKTSVTIK